MGEQIKHGGLSRNINTVSRDILAAPIYHYQCRKQTEANRRRGQMSVFVRHSRTRHFLRMHLNCIFSLPVKPFRWTISSFPLLFSKHVSHCEAFNLINLVYIHEWWRRRRTGGGRREIHKCDNSIINCRVQG